jgi:hypothetical protein
VLRITGLRKNRLFEGEGWSDFTGTNRHVTDNSSEDWSPPLGGKKEQASRNKVRYREENQGSLASETIRYEARRHGVECTAEDGCCENNPYQNIIESQLFQIDGEYYAQKSVWHGSNALFDKHEFAVGAYPVAKTQRVMTSLKLGTGEPWEFSKVEIVEMALPTSGLMVQTERLS